MGGKPKQVDQPVAAASSAGAEASAKASAALSSQMAAQQKSSFNTLFGNSAASGGPLGGTLGGYLSPDYLSGNSSNLTGPFAQQYASNLGNLAQSQAQNRGSMAQMLQNRGFGGNSPSGIASEMALQQQLGQAGQTNQLFGNTLNQQYQTALQNQWNAAGLMSGQGMSAGQGAINAQGNAANAYTNLYGTAGKQAEGSSVWGSLLGAAAGLGGSAMSAWCPAEGSMYLMADDSELPVELLHVGDEIKGIDDEPQTIEEIQSALAPVLRITTDDGHVVRNSRVHAFALPHGGFVVAIHSLGKTIRTDSGTAKVISVENDGLAKVFNVITDGSHTYRADGVWALGVGEAERTISMQKWNDIGDSLLQTVGGY
jgi:hypothetical protein